MAVSVKLPRATSVLRFSWDNPAQRGLTLERVIGARVLSSRHVGLRGQLDIEEAAAVLERSAEDVRGEIRAGFLRPVRGTRPPRLTVHALVTFLAEERADRRAADRAHRRIVSGQDRVIPWEEARRRL